MRSASGRGRGDPAAARVEQIEAEIEFRAGARALRAANGMLGQVIDIIV